MARQVGDTLTNLDHVEDSADELRQENLRLKDQLESIREEIQRKEAEKRRNRTTQGMRGPQEGDLARLAQLEQKYEHLGHEVYKLETTNESLQEDYEEQSSELEKLQVHANAAQHNDVDMEQLQHESEDFELEIEEVEQQLSAYAKEVRELEEAKSREEAQFQETNRRTMFRQKTGNLSAGLADKRKSIAANARKSIAARKSVAPRQTVKEANMRATAIVENQEELRRMIAEEEERLAEEDEQLQELQEQKEELEEAIMQGKQLLGDLESRKEEMDEDFELQMREIKAMLQEREDAVKKYEDSHASLVKKHETVVQQEGISADFAKSLSEGAHRQTEFLGGELEMDPEFAIRQTQMENTRLQEKLPVALQELEEAPNKIAGLHQELDQKRLDLAEQDQRLRDLRGQMKKNSVSFGAEGESSSDEEITNDPEIDARKQEVSREKENIKSVKSIHADARHKLEVLSTQISEQSAQLQEKSENDPLKAARIIFDQRQAKVEDEHARQRKEWDAAVDAAEERLEKDRQNLETVDITGNTAVPIVDMKKGPEMQQLLAKAKEELQGTLTTKRQRMDKAQEEGQQLEKEVRTGAEASQTYTAKVRQDIEKTRREVDEQRQTNEMQKTALEAEKAALQFQEEKRKQEKEDKAAKKKSEVRVVKTRTSRRLSGHVASQPSTKRSKVIQLAYVAVEAAQKLQALIANHVNVIENQRPIVIPRVVQTTVLAAENLSLACNCYDVEVAKNAEALAHTAAEIQDFAEFPAEVNAANAEFAVAAATAVDAVEELGSVGSNAFTPLAMMNSTFKPSFQAVLVAAQATVAAALNAQVSLLGDANLARCQGTLQFEAQHAIEAAQELEAIAATASPCAGLGSVKMVAVAQAAVAASLVLLEQTQRRREEEKKKQEQQLAAGLLKTDVDDDLGEAECQAAEVLVDAGKATESLILLCAPNTPLNRISLDTAVGLAKATVHATQVAQSVALEDDDAKRRDLRLMYAAATAVAQAKAWHSAVVADQFPHNVSTQRATESAVLALKKSEALFNAVCAADADLHAVAEHAVTAAEGAMEVLHCHHHHAAVVGIISSMREVKAVMDGPNTSSKGKVEVIKKSVDLMQSFLSKVKNDRDFGPAVLAAEATVEAMLALQEALEDTENADSNYDLWAAADATMGTLEAMAAVFASGMSDDKMAVMSAVSQARAVEAVFEAERARDVVAGAEMEEVNSLLASLKDVESQLNKLRATRRHQQMGHMWRKAEHMTVSQIRLAQLEAEKEASRRELEKTMRRVRALDKNWSVTGAISELICTNKRTSMH